MRGLHRVGLVVLAALAVGAATTDSVQAQPVWTNDCPDMPVDLESATDAAIETRELGQRAVTICLAETERLEYLIELQEDAIESETTSTAQRVALSPVDRQRLDLIWYGSWATVGTIFALMLAPMMWAAFRWWRP